MRRHRRYPLSWKEVAMVMVIMLGVLWFVALGLFFFAQ